MLSIFRIFILSVVLVCSCLNGPAYAAEAKARQGAAKAAPKAAPKNSAKAPAKAAAAPAAPASAAPPTAGAPGIPGKGQAGGQNVPTAIKSDRMEYNADGQIVIFTGNVYVKRPDFELWADKMTVYLEKSKEGKNTSEAQGMEAGDIDRIVAEHNVLLRSEDKEGTCKKATYYAKQDKFVMEGAPALRDKQKSMVTGGVIVHYLNANRSEVLSGAGATFNAPDKSQENAAAYSPLAPTPPNPRKQGGRGLTLETHTPQEVLGGEPQVDMSKVPELSSPQPSATGSWFHNTRFPGQIADSVDDDAKPSEEGSGKGSSR